MLAFNSALLSLLVSAVSMNQAAPSPQHGIIRPSPPPQYGTIRPPPPPCHVTLYSSATKQSVIEGDTGHGKVLSLADKTQGDTSPIVLTTTLQGGYYGPLSVRSDGNDRSHCLAKQKAQTGGYGDASTKDSFTIVPCNSKDSKYILDWIVEYRKTASDIEGWTIKAKGSQNCMSSNSVYGQGFELIEAPCERDSAIWSTIVSN
ncbi:MAG: hypothetical protein DHS80DRAFT_24547 [Piptocephalis tieghemiana]|nr:MAG: hypothetical protein DHS80DRAFT_24547 [Piptocephalis tieghemiana]